MILKWQYDLTVDEAEYDALAETLSTCEPFVARQSSENSLPIPENSRPADIVVPADIDF